MPNDAAQKPQAADNPGRNNRRPHLPPSHSPHSDETFPTTKRYVFRPPSATFSDRCLQVANIVLYQGKNYDGTGYPDDSRCGQEIPLGARIIRAAADYILWQCRGFSRDGAIGRLNNTTRYDPNVISALDRVVRREHAATDERPTCTVPLSELAPGMTITEDILTMDGSVLLVRQGQELTSVLLQRVRNFNRQTPVMDVVSVLADPIPVH